MTHAISGGDVHRASGSAVDFERQFISEARAPMLGPAYLTILRTFVGHIVGLRAQEQVFDVDTSGHVALVQNTFSCGDRASGRDPCQAVGEYRFPLEMKLAVSSKLIPRPFDTASFNVWHLPAKLAVMRELLLHLAAYSTLIVLLSACGPTSTKLVTRTPDASLMVPCETPQKLPAKPTGNQIDKALVETTRIALDCKAKHDGLIEFEKAAP